MKTTTNNETGGGRAKAAQMIAGDKEGTTTATQQSTNKNEEREVQGTLTPRAACRWGRGIESRSLYGVHTSSVTDRGGIGGTSITMRALAFGRHENNDVYRAATATVIGDTERYDENGVRVRRQQYALNWLGCWLIAIVMIILNIKVFR